MKKVPSKCKEHRELAKGKLQEVMTILRLYKEGDLECGFLYWYPKTPCDPPHSYDDMLFFRVYYDSPNKYLLQEDDIKSLSLLFRIYRKHSRNLYKKDFPYSAIDCLNEGLKEDKSENKLISFIGALEALLIDERKRNEIIENKKMTIKSVLAKSTASFINTKKDRQGYEKIKNDIIQAYNLRSKIAHGRGREVPPHECEEYNNKTEIYARRAIRKWLDEIEQGKTTRDIIGSIGR